MHQWIAQPPDPKDALADPDNAEANVLDPMEINQLEARLPQHHFGSMVSLAMTDQIKGRMALESLSLWNSSLSPGWTVEEVSIFRKAIIRYGVGNWRDIYNSGCIPGKTHSQMYLQTQRLFGQQSLAEFNGLHIDPIVVRKENEIKWAAAAQPEAEIANDKGNGSVGNSIQAVVKKNGFLVNAGARLSRDELRKRIMDNKLKYELAEDEWSQIVLPRRDSSQVIAEKRQQLEEVSKELVQVRQQIIALKVRGESDMWEIVIDLCDQANSATENKPKLAIKRKRESRTDQSV
ncbi:hypothetical protein HDU76_012395 [Blyttiomyces sp. JEL0837]|nr:hypothetical protein HDU76_012395 [Blyttiomyces sp. JEL0837]